mgnify:CR=1 FL=1|tara:strand:- start:10765 stop:11574 length:810 start_codon:yes stop_codon:yes gene_type:complete
MIENTTKGRNNDKKLIILGSISIAILFLIYSRFEYQEITPDAVQSIERVGTSFYILFIISVGMIGIGLRKLQRNIAARGNTSPLSMICNNTLNRKGMKIFIVTFIIYGTFFSMTSGILVYQPEVIFSYHYGAEIPSVHITPCCGPPGYMPKFIAYITEHVGINVVPINLILQIIVSYLVALNTTLAVNAISITKKTGGIGSIGATTGLFIACPTCVGSFLSLFIGSTSAITLTIAITELQTLFIGITIPILILTPFIISRRIIKSQNYS